MWLWSLNGRKGMGDKEGELKKKVGKVSKIRDIGGACRAFNAYHSSFFMHFSKVSEIS